MNIPLVDFGRISVVEFYEDIESRKNEYFAVVSNDYDTYKEMVENGEAGVLFFDADNERTLFLLNAGNYSIHCYDEMERNEMANMKRSMYGFTEIKQSKAFARTMIGELKHIVAKTSILDLSPNVMPYKDEVVNRVQNLIDYITGSYLDDEELIESDSIRTPKIRWNSDVKVLATLFFDLLHGQEKIAKKGESSQTLRPLLRASAIEIQRLLLDNFTDQDGKTISPSTLHTYFNKSKDSRAKSNRIELDYDL